MEKKDRHIRYYLVSSIAYALFFLALFFSLRARIRTNFERGGYREEAMNYMVSKTMKAESVYPVSFWTIDGPVMATRSMETGFSDDMHQRIEALILGPTEEDIRRGMITYVPRDTKLIGLTVKDGMCFINLSKEFLDSTNIDRAVTQIKNTLSPDLELRVSVMVEGNTIS